MGKFNWVELKALVVSIVESLSEDPPPELQGRWGGDWVAASAVRNTLLGQWGPQVDHAEFHILLEELDREGAIKVEQRTVPAFSGARTVVLIRPGRPPRLPRTERVPQEAPPG